ALLAAAPELTAAATVNGQPVTVVGTWFEHRVMADDGAWDTGLKDLRPTWTLAGRWPREDAPELAVGRDLAARLKVAPGQNVTLAIDGSTRSLQVTGLVTAGGRDDARAWAPLETVQALSGRAGQADRVWVSALVRPGPVGPRPDPQRDPAGFE